MIDIKTTTATHAALAMGVHGITISHDSLIQLIRHTNPTLQVLAAMDEATYSNIIKTTNNYLLFQSLYDDHNGSSLDTLKWTIVQGNVSQSEGILTVSVAGNSGSSPKDSEVKSISTLVFPLTILISSASKSAQEPYAFSGAYIYLRGSTSGGIGVSVDAGSNFTVTVTDNGGGNYTITNNYSAATQSGDLVGTPYLDYHAGMWFTGGGNASAHISVNSTGIPILSGNIMSNIISTDVAILSFYKQLKMLVGNGGSTHATPIQAEIYGNADSYATTLNSTKFTIAPADPRIILKRDALDTITASSASQTVWNMTVAGGMPALPNHGTILATLIGVASVLVVEKSVLGDFSDTVVLAENTDYVVDYSTRTATKITLTSGTSIVNAQSKLRLSWIADVMKIDGATNNTALKVKLYLNRTSSAETSPNIQPIPLGSAKYAEMLYET